MKDMKEEEEGIKKLCPIFGVYCIAKCTHKDEDGQICPEVEKNKVFDLARETSGF